MNILKNKTFWLMLFLVTFGTVFRLAFIDKPEGLWNDEYVSWAISTIPLGENFFSAIFAQCHMPLYYFYLKFFIHFFGNSDLMLRLTSLVPGVLSIISMYFVGKEFKNINLGILCAAITSISSFLIYFSHEVRFYALLFFFASLALLYTIKLGKKQNKLNFLLFVISNFLIILTHSIGFVFVIFNLIFVSLWLVKENIQLKKSIMITWTTLSILTLLNLPLLIKIFTTHHFSQWWGHFTFSKVFFLVTDYFSPVLTNLVNAPDNFFYNFTLIFIVFALIPSLIAIAGIVKALKTKDYRILGLFYVCMAFVFILILASMSGKLVFLTKYSIEIYPIVILIMCFGLLEFNKGLKQFLIFAFCFINVFYLFTNPLSAPKTPRNEGHKIVPTLLKNADLKPDDTILIMYYPKDRFEKYYDFKNYNVYSINKGNFYEYFKVNPQEALGSNPKAYKSLFGSESSNYFNKRINESVLSHLKSKHKFSVVVLNDVAMYSPVQMSFLAKNKKEYVKIPFPFLAFSQIRNNLFNQCFKTLQILRIENKGSWTVVTFLKK